MPTLILAGRASMVPWTADRIPGARLELFGADEGGSQMLALENPAKSNRLLYEFLGGAATTSHPPTPREQQHEPPGIDPAPAGPALRIIRESAPSSATTRGGALARPLQPA
jgi:hypothetical protein